MKRDRGTRSLSICNNFGGLFLYATTLGSFCLFEEVLLGVYFDSLYILCTVNFLDICGPGLFVASEKPADLFPPQPAKLLEVRVFVCACVCRVSVSACVCTVFVCLCVCRVFVCACVCMRGSRLFFGFF